MDAAMKHWGWYGPEIEKVGTSLRANPYRGDVA